MELNPSDAADRSSKSHWFKRRFCSCIQFYADCRGRSANRVDKQGSFKTSGISCSFRRRQSNLYHDGRSIQLWNWSWSIADSRGRGTFTAGALCCWITQIPTGSTRVLQLDSQTAIWYRLCQEGGFIWILLRCKTSIQTSWLEFDLGRRRYPWCSLLGNAWTFEMFAWHSCNCSFWGRCWKLSFPSHRQI